MSKLQKLLIFALIFSQIPALAQYPLPPSSFLNTQYESEHLNDSLSHFGLLPYRISFKNDTSFFFPCIENRLNIGNNYNFGYIAYGIGGFIKKHNFALTFYPLLGAGNNPLWWKHKNTLPFIGKSFSSYKNYLLFFDPEFELSFKTKYINFRLGREKFHIGQGYRSVWLDSYAPPYPFIQGDVNIWKVKYVFRISIMHNPDFRFPNKQFYHAFNIAHYLDFSFGPVNLTMFETIMQDPIDSIHAHRGFDINYLNPVIFFRAVDLSLGSPDNVLLGLGGSIKIHKHFIPYAYGLLDEMIVSHLLANDKCWCLKYAANAGFKYFDTFGLKNLFSQAEVSFARPYTYSHDNPILAYGNYYQPLAHPLGANFKEFLFHIIYWDHSNSTIEAVISTGIVGKDIDSLNYGQNIFNSYLTHVKEYGVTIGQGLTEHFFAYELSLNQKITNWLWLKIGILGRYTHSVKGENWNFVNFLSLSSNIINPHWDWL